MHCRKTLTWQELIPVVSFSIQRGTCASCGTNISAQYPIIEALTGILLVALFVSYPAPLPTALITFLVAALLIILIGIDIRHLILPDIYILLLAILAVISAIYTGQDVIEFSRGALIGSGILLLLWLVTHGRGLGLGDVKLLIPLGMIFGPIGTVVLLFLSFTLGGIVGMYLLWVHKATPKTAIPFGPFIAGSAILLLIFPQIVPYATSFIALPVI